MHDAPGIGAVAEAAGVPRFMDCFFRGPQEKEIPIRFEAVVLLPQLREPDDGDPRQHVRLSVRDQKPCQNIFLNCSARSSGGLKISSV